ncbi:YitT family protein [Bacillus lacus]|uniref:YitT family protein n=2 Tax=Metabacillus lacus TaxID=1983721 RepID=A0A7X2LXK0_9BACI|nr:YitT family protein [Metabacillus lacus]
MLLRWSIYFCGLLLMALGIVFTIRAGLGTSSWDVLHIGLFYTLGLTIGTWSILVGALILTLSSILTREFPKLGAYVNMLTVGIFIDLYMQVPFLQTPVLFTGRITMLLSGLVIMAYGMAFYISARCGTGPRDSLMIALVEKTGYSISRVRRTIEIAVLLIGWLLGGPVFIGTVICTLFIGTLAGIAIPQCQQFTDALLRRLFYQEEYVSNSVIKEKM